MSYTHEELGGVCAMSPAVATPDAGSMTAFRTIDVDNLIDALDRAIREAGAKAVERSMKRAERWLALCEKYRPEVEASGVAPI